MDPVPERRPSNPLPFDYHHEKVALTRLAHWLAAQGWDAQLSVRPKNAFSAHPLNGKLPITLDDEFIARFNGDATWQYRYNFYRDQPGNFDLVARREGETLIVDAKGRSASNRRGAVAQMIGNLTLSRRPDLESIRYGVLVPDDPAWNSALANTGGLDWIELYRIGASGPGEINQDDWHRYMTEESAPA